MNTNSENNDLPRYAHHAELRSAPRTQTLSLSFNIGGNSPPANLRYNGRGIAASKMAVEVVSPYRNQLDENYQRDYIEKRAEYEQHGIPEYWIVDPQARLVTVLVLVNGKYQATEFSGSQRIVSQIFPELGLTAAQVLEAR